MQFTSSNTQVKTTDLFYSMDASLTVNVGGGAGLLPAEMDYFILHFLTPVVHIKQMFCVLNIGD